MEKIQHRDFRLDIARALCMCYIIAALHLSQYLGLKYYIYETYIGRLITFSCLGLFTFMSGYLIGGRYDFNRTETKVITFYKKRIVRFYPLFVIATILLYLIGFNNLSSSIYGLIGLAPFVIQQPKTLWYISMLMILYLLTPLINRKGMVWKIGISAILVTLCLGLKLLLFVDTRFIFNLFFYCLGLIMANVNIQYLKEIEHPKWGIHISIIVLFVVVTCLSNHWMQNTPMQLFIAAIGVFAIFSLSCIFERITWKPFRRIMAFVSYGSMVCYLFHRFFYWAGLCIYNPVSVTSKTLYLIGVFIIGLVVSYFIQKIYDNIVNRSK